VENSIKEFVVSEIEKIIDLSARLKRKRHYETTVAISPTANDTDVKAFSKRLKDAIVDLGGTSLRHDDWGRKRLPHPMEKHTVAQFLYMRFVGTQEIVVAVERLLKIEASALRFLTVVLSGPLAETGIQDLVERAPKEPSAAPSLRGEEDEFSFESSY